MDRLQVINKMEEIYRKRKDPDYVRYIAKKYHPEFVDDIEDVVLGKVAVGQPEQMTKISPLAQAVVSGQVDITTLDKETSTTIYKELSESGQINKLNEKEADYLNTTLDVVDQISTSIKENKGFKGAVGLGLQKAVPGLLKPGEGQFIPGTQEVTFETLNNQLLGRLKLEERQKLKGSGQISDSEQKILGEAVASLNLDLPEEEYKKQVDIVKNILTKAAERQNIQRESFIGGTETQPTQTTEPMGQPSQQLEFNSPEEVTKWLQENQNDPQYSVVKQEFEKLGYTGETPTKQVGAQEQPTETMGVTTQAEEPFSIKEDKRGIITKSADAIGKFFGMKKFAEGFGVTVFLMSKEGKELQKKAEEGDKFAIKALSEILDESPSSKEIIGSAALTALNIATLGSAGKVKALTTGGKIAVGATQGAIYGTASGLEQDKGVAGIAGSAVSGAVVGGTIAGAFVGAEKLAKIKAAKRSQEINDAVGKILQGAKKDKQAGLRTLSSINPKEVKIYKDLNNKLYERMGGLGDTMDELLSKDTTKRTLSQLDKVSNVGGKKVKTNYIQKALDHLEEFYAKAESPENAQRITNLLEKAQKEGLTVKEINDIAKEYGMEFGEKAFTKLGEPKTSVTSMAYENIRKGIKTTARDLLPDDTAKLIDKAFSDTYKTLRLTEKMEESVNKLSQKLQGRGFFEKAGNIAGKITDALTGHALRGTLTGVLPSNIGLKTMNSIALQDKLQKNLNIITKGGESKIIKLIEETVKKTNKPITDSVLQKIIIRALED